MMKLTPSPPPPPSPNSQAPSRPGSTKTKAFCVDLHPRLASGSIRRDWRWVSISILLMRSGLLAISFYPPLLRPNDRHSHAIARRKASILYRPALFILAQKSLAFSYDSQNLIILHSSLYKCSLYEWALISAFRPRRMHLYPAVSSYTPNKTSRT